MYMHDLHDGAQEADEEQYFSVLMHCLCSTVSFFLGSIATAYILHISKLGNIEKALIFFSAYMATLAAAEENPDATILYDQPSEVDLNDIEVTGESSIEATDLV